MAARFLLDENVEPRVRDRLTAHGHGAEHVRDVSALGPGASDAEIAAHSNRDERVILTYDVDFVVEHDRSEFHAVVLFDEPAVSAREVADIAHNVVRAYPGTGAVGVEYGSRDWL